MLQPADVALIAAVLRRQLLFCPHPLPAQERLAHPGSDVGPGKFFPEITLAVAVERRVQAGRLDDYKVLYVGGPYMERKTARAIKEWVRGGGILVADAGTYVPATVTTVAKSFSPV